MLRRAYEGVRPPRSGELPRQLPQGGPLPPSQIQDNGGPAPRCFHSVRVGKIIRGKGRIQRQMREVMSPETARKTLAPDVGMRQVAQFLCETLCFAGTGGDHWAEAWQDQPLPGATPKICDPRLENSSARPGSTTT